MGKILLIFTMLQIYHNNTARWQSWKSRYSTKSWVPSPPRFNSDFSKIFRVFKKYIKRGLKGSDEPTVKLNDTLSWINMCGPLFHLFFFLFGLFILFSRLWWKKMINRLRSKRCSECSFACWNTQHETF